MQNTIIVSILVIMITFNQEGVTPLLCNQQELNDVITSIDNNNVFSKSSWQNDILTRDFLLMCCFSYAQEFSEGGTNAERHSRLVTLKVNNGAGTISGKSVDGIKCYGRAPISYLINVANIGWMNIASKNASGVVEAKIQPDFVFNLVQKGVKFNNK